MQSVREVCVFWRVFWRPCQNTSVTITPCNLCERCARFGAVFWRPCQNASVTVTPCNLCVRCYDFWACFGGPVLATVPKRERDYRPKQFVRALLWFWECFGGPVLATVPKHERDYRPKQLCVRCYGFGNGLAALFWRPCQNTSVTMGALFRRIVC